MTIEELSEAYVSFPEIAAECGVSITTAHNWANYHRYFPKQTLVGKPVVSRADYERFKALHPELVSAGGGCYAEERKTIPSAGGGGEKERGIEGE